VPYKSKQMIGVECLILRGATLVVCYIGVVWGILLLPRSEAVDKFRRLETHLLQFESFRRTAAIRSLETASAQQLSPCDTQAQRALFLMEAPLADAARRSGATREYDERARALEARAQAILSCAPRDSFTWLLVFGLEVGHGVLDEHSFDLLAMSYETSPNEAWIAIRRAQAATPLLVAAPALLQQKILAEFQGLVRHGFSEVAARCYLRAPDASRALLQARIEQLDTGSQKAFADALQRLQG
jgi:hypothetical protein